MSQISVVAAESTLATTTPMWASFLVAGIPAVAAIVAAVIAAIAASSAKKSEAKALHVRDLENRIAERKFKVYEPMIELLRRLIDPQEASAVVAKQAEFRQKLSEFSAWIAIYGSDDAVTYFQRFMQCTYHSAPVHVLLRMYSEFVLAARRDMGYPETRVTGEHILGIRLSDIYAGKWIDTFTLPLGELYAREDWKAPWEAAPPATK